MIKLYSMLGLREKNPRKGKLEEKCGSGHQRAEQYTCLARLDVVWIAGQAVGHHPLEHQERAESEQGVDDQQLIMWVCVVEI